MFHPERYNISQIPLIKSCKKIFQMKLLLLAAGKSNRIYKKITKQMFNSLQ